MGYLLKARGGLEGGGAREGEGEAEAEGVANIEKDCTPSTDKHEAAVTQSELLPSEDTIDQRQ